MAGEGEELFPSDDCGRWRASLDRYDETLALVESSKKRSSSSNTLTLLDKWFQIELPATISSRSKPHLTHEELCKLMEWKLTRGKFRPRLRELVSRNSSEEVEAVTGTAIAALPNLERAVTLASKLSAVGPATASAILCAASRDVPFMADEAALSVSLGKLTYSLKQYLTYARILQDRARQLTGGGEREWTAHEVELALWTHYQTTRLAPPQSTLGKRREREQHTSGGVETVSTSGKRPKLSKNASP